MDSRCVPRYKALIYSTSTGHPPGSQEIPSIHLCSLILNSDFEGKKKGELQQHLEQSRLGWKKYVTFVKINLSAYIGEWKQKPRERQVHFPLVSPALYFIAFLQAFATNGIKSFQVC